jgi:2-succinyl-6-hydroxy-2,4-cyclohexadiene-1-carboxylate synthase
MLSRTEQGDPRSPPCIFLHGFLGAKEDWKAMWDELTSQFFCIGFDLPGHGKSPPISPDYLTVLEKEISASSSEKPVLIGYSMGGRLALQLSSLSPASYSHLILMSAHPGLKEEEKPARLLQDQKWIDKLKNGSMEAFLNEWYDQSLFLSLHKRPDLLRRLIAERKNQDPKKIADVFQMLSPAVQKNAVEIPRRALFLYGEEDEKYQKIYSALTLEGIAVRKIESSGHAVHVENPKACAMRIREYVEERS